MVNEENVTVTENNEHPSSVASSNKLPEENLKESEQGRKYEIAVHVYLRITYICIDY